MAVPLAFPGSLADRFDCNERCHLKRADPKDRRNGNNHGRSRCKQAGVSTTISALPKRIPSFYFNLQSKLIYFGGQYLWYAASYGDCIEPSGPTGCAGSAIGSCGFQTNHNVSLWTSVDLKTWEPHGHVIEMASVGIPNAIMFCPKVGGSCCEAIRGDGVALMLACRLFTTTRRACSFCG